MDETTGTEQGTTSGQSGQSSGSKGGTTSKDKGKLYSDAEITKIKSDAAAGAGRQRKAAEQERDTLKQDLQSATSRLDALEREQNESRLAEARGDPDQLRAYQREQDTKKREREAGDKEGDLVRREAQLKSDLDELAKDKGVVHIAYTAAEYGLDEEELKSLGISDPDTLDKVAEKLAAAKGKGTGEGEGEGEGAEGGEGGEGAEEFVPDSGEGTGAGGEPTAEQLSKMPMGQYAAYVQKRDEPKKQ